MLRCLGTGKTVNSNSHIEFLAAVIWSATRYRLDVSGCKPRWGPERSQTPISSFTVGTGLLRGGKAPSLKKEWSYSSSPPVELHACCSAKFTCCIELLEVLFVMPKLAGPDSVTHSSEQEALMFPSACSAKCCEITLIQAAVFPYRIIPRHNSQRFNHTSLNYDLALSNG
jgi:hypothetical protein